MSAKHHTPETRYVFEGRYCQPLLQSADEFTSRDAARSALRELKENAAKQGILFIGKVVRVADAKKGRN